MSLPTQCNGVNGAFCKAHDTPLPPDVQMNEETRRTLYDWFYGGHPKMSESMIRSLPRPPPGPPMMKPKDYCYLAPRKRPIARQPRQLEQTQTTVTTTSRVTFMPRKTFQEQRKPLTALPVKLSSFEALGISPALMHALYSNRNLQLVRQIKD